VIGLEKLHTFSYKFLEGPLPPERLRQELSEGNCRLAVQDYYFTLHGIYLGSPDIVPPEAFKSPGIFINDMQNDEDEFFTSLKAGDIIYAEKYRDSSGRKFKSVRMTEAERMIKFHMGVYLGILNDDLLSRLPNIDYTERGKPIIWHSSYISRGTDVWTKDKFCYYYQPIIAKRILV
jgi:hypothetical protein